jgi:hypothetical protein
MPGNQIRQFHRHSLSHSATQRASWAKTELVSFRATPTFKRALKLAADSEKRRQSNFLDKLVLDYCDQHGLIITPPEPAKGKPRKNRTVVNI